MFKKGQFVQHPRKSVWGIGIVTKDPQGGVVRVFFENEIGVKQLQIEAAGLELVADPGPARLFLENVLVDQSVKGVTDRQPFPKKVERFKERFKGGLYGPLLEAEERHYKQKAQENFVEQLNQAEFSALMEAEQWEELTERIKRSYTINLLSKFESIRLSDVLKDPEAAKRIAQGLYELLYGEAGPKHRFEGFARVLEDYDCAKWPIITLPLFLAFPEDQMFVKPTVTQEAAANRGFDIQYESQLNWNTYERVRLFAQDLFDRLLAYRDPELRPRDMIDVQTFMWCTFTKGWSDANIAKQSAAMEIE